MSQWRIKSSCGCARRAVDDLRRLCTVFLGIAPSRATPRVSIHELVGLGSQCGCSNQSPKGVRLWLTY